MYPSFLGISIYFYLALNTLAQTNVSVSQGSPLILYSGDWSLRADSGDIGGSHMRADRNRSSAVMSFSGVAVYYMSPKWPYPVRTELALDGGTPVRLDLQDHDSTVQRNGSATLRSAVIPGGRWTGLRNGNHTLRISVPAGDQLAIVDNIIYTEVDTPDNASSTTQTATRTNSTSSSSRSSTRSTNATSTRPPRTKTILSTSSDSSKTLTVTVIVIDPTAQSENITSQNSSTLTKSQRYAIAFGVVGGLILLALLFLCRWYILRRINRDEPSSETQTQHDIGTHEHDEGENRKRPHGSDGFSTRQIRAFRSGGGGGEFDLRPLTQLEPFVDSNFVVGDDLHDRGRFPAPLPLHRLDPLVESGLGRVGVHVHEDGGEVVVEELDRGVQNANALLVANPVDGEVEPVSHDTHERTSSVQETGTIDDEEKPDTTQVDLHEEAAVINDSHSEKGV